ncbi:helix-turn-helix transcriptional regulator [Variovorax sp. RA8]|uniref:helix-turn-helix transcriptional regulator n=1 Tax=Variovorax sp. (strain JCM 16519 / RA8) TaxID=662548 RepID=UPI000A6BA0FD|nr:LuxR C-terminal-related transcriptional regulator [Variovorax sp. RA8]VTU22997.1 DNA-binding transcriptional activator UhpA [Variovorax sp. RA8]
MKTRTSEDVLTGAARFVSDGDSLEWWVEELLKAILPSAAVLCGQSIPHSGGYTSIQTWSFGLPPAYEAAIVCVGSNVRSPVLTRLIRSGGPEFFDVEEDRGVDADPFWRASFRRAGWYNVLGLSHVEGQGDGRVLTAAAFYNVGQEMVADRHALQQQVMPALHAALSRLYRCEQARAIANPAAVPQLTFTPTERAVLDLLLRGMTNKEIGRHLGKSGETIKRQLAMLMNRVGVRNRVELAHRVLSGEPPGPAQSSARSRMNGFDPIGSFRITRSGD